MDHLELIRRSLPSEITAGDGEPGRILRGFIPYNSPAKIFERGKAFTEVIRPGAFARAVAGARDVIATFNHNVDRMLGRTASGTLRLTDSPEGLRYEVTLPESAADVRELLARGDLRGSSFTAWPLQRGDKWTKDLRELLALELVELGPVVSPAYPDSGAVLRAGETPPRGSSPALIAAVMRLMERS
jgi:uncharacterized protein